MTIPELTTFLGWCTVINFGLLIFSSIMVVGCRSWAGKIHGKMFQLDENEISKAYFDYLARFKIFVIVFNLVPYIALKIMAGS